MLYVDDELPTERPFSEVHIMSDDPDHVDLLELGDWILDHHPDLLIGWVNRAHPQFMRIEVRRDIIPLLEQDGFLLIHTNSQQMCYTCSWPGQEIGDIPGSIYHLIRANEIAWIKEALKEDADDPGTEDVPDHL